jgi:hypothetical protein
MINIKYKLYDHVSEDGDISELEKACNENGVTFVFHKWSEFVL